MGFGRLLVHTTPRGFDAFALRFQLGSGGVCSGSTIVVLGARDGTRLQQLLGAGSFELCQPCVSLGLFELGRGLHGGLACFGHACLHGRDVARAGGDQCFVAGFAD